MTKRVRRGVHNAADGIIDDFVSNVKRPKTADNITKYPFFKHYRGSPVVHTLRYKKGKVVDAGRGITFFFRPLNTMIAEVPISDQELPFVFNGRSSDFQDVTVQGVITYRVEIAPQAASRVDFTISPDDGKYVHEPRVQIESLLSQMAQQSAWTYLASVDLGTTLTAGFTAVRDAVIAGFALDTTLSDMGMSVASVRVSSVKPRADVERALQVPMFESIQQESDKAQFERRAVAVERERAIQENELKNEIELATRRKDLIEQEATNKRRETETTIERDRLTAASQAERVTVTATANAEARRVVGDADAAAEQALMDVYGGLPTHVLAGLAFKALGENLHEIGHLSLTPDLLHTLVAQLTQNGVNTGDAGDGH